MQPLPNPSYPSFPFPRKQRRWPWIIAIIVALIIGYAAGTGSHISSTAEPTANSQPVSNAQPTAASKSSGSLIGVGSSPAPAPGTQHFMVGQIVKDGDWQITITSVKTSQGQDFDTPKAGRIFLLIDVTLQNISNATQPVSSLAMFTLRDSAGQEYTETILSSGSAAPNGQADAGQQIKGTLPYEVPITQHQFLLAFIGHYGEQQVLFDVKV